MAGAKLAIPAGFEEVSQETPATAGPPIPAGFEEVKQETPKPAAKVTPVDDETYNTQATAIVANGGGLPELDAYNAKVGRQFDDARRSQIKGILDSNQRFRFVPNPEDTPAIGRFAMGVNRGNQHLLEGAGQLAIRGAGAVGAISPETAASAQDQLATFGDNLDKANVIGTAGNVGEFVGEAAPTAMVPFAGPARAGALGLAARGAKLFGTGAAVGALNGAEHTAAEQDSKALLSGGLTALGVPLVEKLVGSVGVPIARKFMDRFTEGQGKKLFEANGNLTPAGRVFKARLMHITPDEDLVGQALEQIRTTNPKRLPDDKNVVPEMLAQKEKVPLTIPMKTRDAKGMQDFASTETGARGLKSSQDKALDTSASIDDAIMANVESVKGSKTTSADAAQDVADRTAGAAKLARDRKNKLYDPINKSSERITTPAVLLDARDAFVTSVGETGFRTLRKTEPATAAFVDELQTLGRKKVLPFGELWSLSKRVNEAARAPGSSGAIRELKGKVNDLIDNATPDMFESGDRGVFDQLKRANAANRDYKTRFSKQNKVGLPDRAGAAVERIIAGVDEGGNKLTPEAVEQTIFGNAKSLNSATAKQAAITIKRLVKASPQTAIGIREMTLNRLMDSMVDRGVERAINPMKAKAAIDDVISNNKSLLTAAGLTEAEIGKLKANGYLASLKVPPPGARQRGSSATTRSLNSFKEHLWKSLISSGPFAGIASLGAGTGPALAGAAAAAGGATVAGGASALRTRAILSTAPVKASKALDRGERVALKVLDAATRGGASRSGKREK